jgi:hypothetical protein
VRGLHPPLSPLLSSVQPNMINTCSKSVYGASLELPDVPTLLLSIPSLIQGSS